MNDKRSQLNKRSSGGVTRERAKARKGKSVSTEELTPERRAELELKRAARELRRRPPSI